LKEAMNKIQYNIPFADYLRWEGLSPSRVKLAGDSLLAFRWAELNPDSGKQTPQMMLGSAVHCALLEPNSFKNRYAVYEGERRGKAWQQFAEDNAAFQILTQAEHDKAWACARGAAANPLAAKLLKSASHVELSMRWIDPLTQLQCKGRPDGSIDGGDMLDLKTISKLDARTIQRNIIEYDYAMQIAAYLDGYFQITGQVKPASIIFVETQPPFDCAVVEFAEWETVGASRWQSLLNKIAQARRDNHYPGVAWDEPLPVLPPDWYVENNIELEGAELA
jgi:exodeoxyribonuclease VIII